MLLKCPTTEPSQQVLVSVDTFIWIDGFCPFSTQSIDLFFQHANPHRHCLYSLSSMGVNYGSGSGQQVVTAANGKEDSNSLWTVKEAENGAKPCKTGQSFRCGDKIRLEHVPTGKNLHSHGS